MVRSIVFDLDGTIYFGQTLADKANEVIKYTRQKYEHIFFVTNNSAKSKKEIYNKLINLGIDLNINELITASDAIVHYLKEKKYKSVCCIGTEPLKQEILNANIKINEKHYEAIVVGYNRNFKLDDLNPIISYKNSNIELIIANKEHSYPIENGIMIAGAGPIVTAVEYILNKKFDLCIGKPNTYMLKNITKNYSIEPQEICVVGDSYDSDIQMSKTYGSQGICITNKIYKDCTCINKLSELLEVL